MNTTTPIAFASALLIATASQTVLAEEVKEESKKDWTAQAEIGFLKTSGNSESETLKAKLGGTKSYGQWKHSGNLEALNTSQSDVRSAEKYLAKAQSDYAVSEKTYALGALSWEKDRFSSYAYQASMVLGVGYKAINDNDMTLNFELAPGFRVSEPDPGEKEEEAILRGTQKLTKKLSKTSSIEQSLSSDYGDSNTVTKFNIALTSQVAGDLSMKVGYGLTHNSEVADDADHTDTETSVTLVYKFD